MNLKQKFFYLNCLIFFQGIIDLSFFIVIKEGEGNDCYNFSVYLLIDTILKILCLFFPLFVLYNGFQVDKYYLLGNLTQILLFLSNLIYPFLLIIYYSLPNTGENCQNYSLILIWVTIISIISNILYFYLFRNTLKREYQIIKECVVCLENINDDEEELRLSCSHLFHKNCILEWGIKQAKCPICRKEFSIFIS